MTDLVRLVGESVALKRKGKDFVGLCPFHDDRTPSMGVSPTKQIYKCWSCGAGGDCFSWMMNFHKMSFPEAIEHLAERAGIKLTPVARARPSQGGAGFGSEFEGIGREDLARANAVACEFFRVILRHPEHGAAARGVLERRGVSPSTADRFLIGAAPDRWDGLLAVIEKKGLDVRPFVAAGLLKRRESGGGLYDAFRNRLMFPIENTLGQVVAFGGRKINDQDEPKYLNSPESALFNKSATLYALPQAVRPQADIAGNKGRGVREEKCAVVVEGYMDAVACHQAGVQHVVATLGTALNTQGARVLARQCEKVVLLFDGDEAGQRAADRAVEVLFDSTLDVRIATMSRAAEFGGGNAKDPDELVKQTGGVEVLRRLIDAGTDALLFRFERLSARAAGLGVQGKARLIEEEIQRLVDLGLSRLSPVHKQMIVQRIAGLAGVGEQVIREAIVRSRPSVRRAGTDEGEASGGSRETVRPVGPLESALACLLAEPALWEQLGVAEREWIKPDRFEREAINELVRTLEACSLLGPAFSLPRLRAASDDEVVIGVAVDLASAVEQVVAGGRVSSAGSGNGSVARMLRECLDRLAADMAKQERLAAMRRALGR